MLVTDYINNNIEEHNIHLTDNDLCYFDLEEGKTYYLSSGYLNSTFKVISKSESQYEGIPYYVAKYVKTSHDDGTLGDKVYDTERPLGNNMVFGKYQMVMN